MRFRWRFSVVADDVEIVLGPDGAERDDESFVGDVGEAAAEAYRRALEWERLTGRVPDRVQYESRGVVP